MFLKATATDLCLNIHALYAPAMDHRTNNYLFLCVSLYVQKDLARMCPRAPAAGHPRKNISRFTTGRPPIAA